MKRGYVDTPDGQIHYRTEGEGDVLLLLHQIPSSSNMFDRAIPLFARRYRTIAPDILGYGDSDKPNRQMEIPEHAKCMINFLNALGIAQVHVAGHHTGAGIGVELAAAFPERVRTLIINGAPFWQPEERAQLMRGYAPPLVLKEDGSHLMFLWERAKKMSPDAGLELWQRSVLQTLKSGEYYNSAYNAMFRFDIGPRLLLLECPTLVMAGDGDMLYQANKQVLPLIPRAREAVVHGTDGLIVDKKTEEYVKTIMDFLANPGV